jgi:hypothetical protein
MKNWKKIINRQIEKVKENLKPEALMHDGIEEFTNLIEIFFEYMEEKNAQENYEESSKSIREGRCSLRKKREAQARESKERGAC